MKAYVLSLCAGLLVGIIYSVLNVRSPAPPMIALVGLLGILIGEQIIPMTRHVAGGSPIARACVSTQAHSHLFGRLPGRHLRQTSETEKTET
jgi:XapX domain-containing protein